MIGKRGIVQTYSKFLGCLDLQHSSFQHYLDHQYLLQCKDTVLDCLHLQNSRQQLIEKHKRKTFKSFLIMKNWVMVYWQLSLQMKISEQIPMCVHTFLCSEILSCMVKESVKLKSLLIMKGQKHNRGAQKMNLFTTLVEL